MEPKNKPLSLLLPDDLREKLMQKAKESYMKLGPYCRMVLIEKVKGNE